MRLPIRFAVYSFALLYCCFGVAFARQKACPIPPPSPFKHNALIATSYDKIVDRMRTSMQHPHALTAGAAPLYLYASFLHDAPTTEARPTINIVFVSIAPSALYAKAHTVSIDTDGKPLDGSAAAHYRAALDETGAIIETMRLSVPFEALQNIINAKRVTTRINSVEIQLTENHLEAFRDLASVAAKSPQGWREAASDVQ